MTSLEADHVVEEGLLAHAVSGVEDDRGQEDVEKYFRIENRSLLNIVFIDVTARMTELKDEHF